MIVLLWQQTGETEQAVLKVLVCWSEITTITTYLVRIHWRCGCYYYCCCCFCRHHITRFISFLSCLLLLYLLSGSSSLHGTFFVFNSLLSLLSSFHFFLRVLYYDFFSVVDCLCCCCCCIQNFVILETSTFEFYVPPLQYSLNRCGESIKRINTLLCASLKQIEHIIFSLCVCHRSSAKIKSWMCV